MNLTGLQHVKSDELQENILSTYFSLRLGIVILSVGLPLVLYFGGTWLGGIHYLANSMSAYYGEGGGTMRNWFVGVLWAVGWFLYLYKGFSTLENYLLNFAGGFAVLIAMAPCNCWDDVGPSSRLHWFSAIMFFLCMASVCFFCAKDTIKLLPDKATQNSFRRQYHAIGVVLALSPVAAAIASFALAQHDSLKFFIEAFGAWTFAYYWFTKSREFRVTSAEKLAADGKVENQKGYGLVRVDVAGQNERLFWGDLQQG